jgi:hypothetical protein
LSGQLNLIQDWGARYDSSISDSPLPLTEYREALRLELEARGGSRVMKLGNLAVLRCTDFSAAMLEGEVFWGSLQQGGRGLALSRHRPKLLTRGDATLEAR